MNILSQCKALWHSNWMLGVVVFVLIIGGVVGMVYAPAVGAQNKTTWPLVVCGRADQVGTPDARCQPCHIFILIQRLANFIWYAMMLPIGVVLILWAGVLMLWGGISDANSFTRGKKILLNAFIGMIIIFIAWLVVDYVLKALTFNPGQTFGPWNQIQCTPSSSCNVPAEFQCADGPEVTYAGCTFHFCDPALAAYYQAAASGNGFTLNGNSPQLAGVTTGQNKCSTGVFGNNSQAVKDAAAKFNVPANAFAALLCTETSCGKDVRLSSAGAGGIAQVMPGTACAFRNTIPGCSGSTVTDQAAVIQWMNTPQNGLEIGAQVYADCLRRANGNATLAAACYNGGTEAITQSTKPGCQGQLAFQCLANPGWAETRDKHVPTFSTTLDAINTGCNPFLP